MFDVPVAVFAVPVAAFGDPVILFDVPYELLVFDAVLVRLFDAVVVSPRIRLIMSFQLVLEHPPSATSNAPATAVMRKSDVLISISPLTWPANWLDFEGNRRGARGPGWCSPHKSPHLRGASHRRSRGPAVGASATAL